MTCINTKFTQTHIKNSSTEHIMLFTSWNLCDYQIFLLIGDDAYAESALWFLQGISSKKPDFYFAMKTYEDGRLQRIR